MRERPARASTAGTAYLELRKLARSTNRPTHELLQLYGLEGFLDRLGGSVYRDSCVLKGGVLLAAFGNRRPTRDVDLAGKLPANASVIRSIVNEILVVPVDDGLAFDLSETSVDKIREDADYPGFRAKVLGQLSTAVIRFHVDINIGDPIWPAPIPVILPGLLDREAVVLHGYSPELILAEKIVTALQRGRANTRWRDFLDIASLARTEIDSETLSEAIRRVAEHRSTPIVPLATALDGFPGIAQARWFAWRRKQNLAEAPVEFETLLGEVSALIDPILREL